MPSKNLKHMNMGYSKSEDEKGVGPGDFDAGTPESLPSPERPPLRHIDKYIRPECPCLTKRYTIALLTCVGFIISFGMRCNMGMAKLKKIHGMAVFNWTVAVESAVDSSFFWGYLVTQVPGGFLASAYPANRIFGTAIAISSFMNLLVPGATSLHPACVIIVRICQGFVEYFLDIVSSLPMQFMVISVGNIGVQCTSPDTMFWGAFFSKSTLGGLSCTTSMPGVTYPACHGIWRFWAPPLERSRLATLAFCGSYAGVVLGMPLSGMLAGGISWQAPFYFYGVVGLLWYLFWLWLSFEKPSKHPSISARELQYIEQSLGQSVNQAMPTMSTTPWGAFLTSLPVYAIVVANFCRSWNFYLLVLFQAPYLQSSFNMTIEETGFVGALPHLLMTIIVPLGGLLADHVRKKGYLTTTNVRKVFNCGGFGMEACFFMVVAYAQTKVAATVALTLGVAFSGFAISGFNVNHLDIAPRYASILMGMSNGIGTIAGLICPIAIDNITKDHTRDSWKTVFIMAAMVHLFGVTFYALFASGELQPWAEPAAASPAADKKWNPLDEAYQLDPGRQLPPAGDQPTSPPPPPVPGVPPKRPPPPTQMSTDSMTQSAGWGPNYGAVEQTLASQQPPPFSNHIEPVQPENRDAYYNYGDKDSGF